MEFGLSFTGPTRKKKRPKGPSAPCAGLWNNFLTQGNTMKTMEDTMEDEG